MKLVLVLLLAASLGLTGCSSLEITDVEGKKYVPNEYELTIYCYRQGYNGEEIPVGGLDVGLFHRREDFAPFRSGTTDWNGIYTTKVTAESRLYIGVWKDGIRVHRPLYTGTHVIPYKHSILRIDVTEALYSYK